jgi:predicted secreted Zn-dependent protease
MIKATSRLVMTAAAASLAFAPIAATAANTRAANSTATYSAAGEGRDAKGEKLNAQGAILAILAGAAFIGGIIILADDDDDNQSPGGN